MVMGKKLNVRCMMRDKEQGVRGEGYTRGCVLANLNESRAVVGAHGAQRHTCMVSVAEITTGMW